MFLDANSASRNLTLPSLTSLFMIPRLAIITQNTLEAAGLKSILDEIIPMADVAIFDSLEQLKDEHAVTPFFHFFITPEILIDDVDFFMEHARQTIVLSVRHPSDSILRHFHVVNTSQSQRDLVKAILRLHGQGHPQHGHPDMPGHSSQTSQIEISNREAEVLALVAKGFINKEIADKLCISLPTVVSHRKNICEKLHLRSVSALTIYAVTHGIVSVDEI